jgi:hypothetical protein
LDLGPQGKAGDEIALKPIKLLRTHPSSFQNAGSQAYQPKTQAPSFFSEYSNLPKRNDIKVLTFGTS